MQIARTSSTTAAWGGEGKHLPKRLCRPTQIAYYAELLQKLRSYCHLLKSSIQSHLFLVDPSKADIEAHTTLLFDDLDFSLSSSPVPIHRRPRQPSSESPPNEGPSSQRISVLHETMNPPPSTRMALLSGFSQLTRATRHAAQNILSHPLAKPVSSSAAHSTWSGRLWCILDNPSSSGTSKELSQCARGVDKLGRERRCGRV